jgi:hypothetical protein
MNKLFSKLAATVIIAALLIYAAPMIMPAVKAQPPVPSFYVTPDTETFTPHTASVGTLFNVTVWAAAPNGTDSWGIQLGFNASLLQAVTAGFTNVATSMLFKGHSSTPLGPVIDNVGNTTGGNGSVEISETLLGQDYIAANTASVCYVTFNITAAPAINQALTSFIDPGFGLPPVGETLFILQAPSPTYPTGEIDYPNTAYCTYSFSTVPVIHDVVVASVSASSSVVKGTSLPVSVVVLNNGTVAETSVVVNATANGTLIGQQTVPSLGAGSNQTLSFSWTTTSVSVGTYTITGTVTPVVNQTDLSGISKNVTVQVLAVTAQYSLTVTSVYDSPSPSSGLFNSGTNITESVTSPVSGPSGTNYVCTGWTGTGSVPASGTGLSVTFEITSNSSITWNWKTQYQVTFNEAGVGSTFSGTVVTVDSVNYALSGLPVSFWWDNGSSHSFAFASPLAVGSTQYVWSSTSGLSNLQNGTLEVTGSGNVVGTYEVPGAITFSQVGIGSDFKGTVLIVDGTPYNVAALPVSFEWSMGSVHNFACESPLTVGTNSEQYVWTNTSGLSSSQNGSITVTTYGSITGNYKTQYYLTVTSPYDSPTPSSGWFDSGTGITESVTSPASGSTGTQYVCTGWTGTGNVPASGNASSVSFTITQTSTITWNWSQHVEGQYQVTFGESGVGSDFSGTVLVVDGVDYAVGGLPVSFSWVSGSSHSFAFLSPLAVSANKTYVWNGTSGLSNLQKGTLTVSSSGNITGNYTVQTPVVTTPLKIPLLLALLFFFALGIIGAIVLLFLLLFAMYRRRRRKKTPRHTYTVIVHPHI